MPLPSVNLKKSDPSTCYFHGLPGSAAELRLLNRDAGPKIEVIHPLDFRRFEGAEPSLGKVRIVGFSLGAFSALRLAALKPQWVKELILISPAAPLETGEYLHRMAGAPVFKTAKNSKLGFAALTAIHSVLAAVTPRLLLRQIFAESCDKERALLNDPVFVSILIDGLKNSLGANASLYRKTVRSYVGPWADDLKAVRCHCRIFHGERDNWAPMEMAKAIADGLPSEPELIIEEGLGHYSTLAKTLPSVLF